MRTLKPEPPTPTEPPAPLVPIIWDTLRLLSRRTPAPCKPCST
ncbi:hypothetical protein [Winogradskya humida]|nr:hypothetical protein [Actinoplanes humidus]